MYAVLRIAGFQYLVKEGDVVTVPHLGLEPGARLRLEDVLFLRTANQAIAGRPHVPEPSVEAEVVENLRGPKLHAFKFRRRENYRRKLGHRQLLTKLRISKIDYMADSTIKG